MIFHKYSGFSHLYREEGKNFSGEKVKLFVEKITKWAGVPTKTGDAFAKIKVYQQCGR